MKKEAGVSCINDAGGCVHWGLMLDLARWSHQLWEALLSVMSLRVAQSSSQGLWQSPAPPHRRSAVCILTKFPSSLLQKVLQGQGGPNRISNIIPLPSQSMWPLSVFRVWGFLHLSAGGEEGIKSCMRVGWRGEWAEEERGSVSNPLGKQRNGIVVGGGLRG